MLHHAGPWDLNTIVLVVVLVWAIARKASKDKTCELKKFFIMPVVFAYLMASMVLKTFVLASSSYVGIIIGMVIGTVIGYLLRSSTKIKADKEQKLVCVEGGWWNVIITLIVLAAKFASHVVIKMFPHAKNPGGSQTLLLIILGAATFLAIGQALAFYHKYINAESVHLDPPPKKK